MLCFIRRPSEENRIREVSWLCNKDHELYIHALWLRRVFIRATGCRSVGRTWTKFNCSLIHDFNAGTQPGKPFDALWISRTIQLPQAAFQPRHISHSSMELKSSSRETRRYYNSNRPWLPRFCRYKPTPMVLQFFRIRPSTASHRSPGSSSTNTSLSSASSAPRHDC